MSYLSSIFTGSFSSTVFLVFLIMFFGYLLGSVRIKGVQLGTAAVFLIALLFGHFGFADDSYLHNIGLITTANSTLKTNMSLVQSIGLICFVTSVGYIAGPNFFRNLKRNASSYVLLAAMIIGLGTLTCAAIIIFTKVDSAMAVGLLSGSLTTTPGFAAAQDVVAGNEYLLNEVTVGHAIAYPFGVVGVVLFVQIVPKLLNADMLEERSKINSGESVIIQQQSGLKSMDAVGLGAFSLAVIIGIVVGKISIPLPGGAKFELGNTGGALIVGLLLGHFGHIGRISLRADHSTLQVLREFGLAMFLIGAGVPGGSGFVSIIREQGMMLFIYGALMTLLPMIGGFIFARYILRLSLLNNLGSITGGMTSTPALGMLISVAGTDDVASSYAAAYPVALVLVVLASQFLITLL